MENWKRIDELPYYVSDIGRVKNSSDKIMTATLNGAGYYRVDLREDNRLKITSVHRAVAKAFLLNPNAYPVVNHKDSNRLNNVFSNLEWCTYSWNNKHACLFGNAKIGMDRPNAILTDGDIPVIKDMLEQGVRNCVIARLFGVDDGTISELRLGRTWMHTDDRVFPPLERIAINRKLSASDIPVIRSMIQNGDRDCDIGRLFEVARGTINQIRQGKTWSNY
jgi:hypothetical protein